MRIGLSLRDQMRPDTAEAVAWRLADNAAAAELRAEFDRRLDEAAPKGAEAVLDVLGWHEKERASRRAALLAEAATASAGRIGATGGR